VEQQLNSTAGGLRDRSKFRASALVTGVVAATLSLTCSFAPTYARSPEREVTLPPAASVINQSASTMAAAAIARVAMADLRLVGSPTSRDYEVAAEMLRVAHDLVPEDQDFLRLLIEARTGAGDDDAIDELGRRLLKLDPSDTVNQLRVASRAIARNQNADVRLAAYERFLSEGGSALDPSVRSRLALDAALLSREQGDLAMFEQRLMQSLELDSSNKDAATLALTFYADSIDDPSGRLDMLLNVLLADPFDEQVHLAVAQELARSGAYRGSQRFFSNAFALATRRGLGMPDDVRDEATVVDWILRGAEAFVTGLNDEIATARGQVARQRERLELAQERPDQMPDPAQVRLPLELERLRVLASGALGKPDLINSAVEEANRTVQMRREAVQDLKTRPKEITDEFAAEIVRVLTLESIWFRLWADRDLAAASADLAEIRRNPNTDPREVERIEAWLRLRYREFDDAERLLRALGNDNLAIVGLAVLSDAQGKTEEAIERYAEIARRLPASPAGAFAITRVQVLANATPGVGTLAGLRLLPDAGTRLESAAAAVPSWLERMLENPLEFMTLRADLVAGPEGRVGLFDKVGVRLRLRNVSRVPLGLGPDRPLNSRLLSVPSMRFGSVPLRRQSHNGVISLDRRLRLLPREELVVEFWPDNGVSGLTMQEELRRPVNVHWRLLQGFTPGEGGVFQEGPFSLTADVGPLVRPALNSAYMKPSELLERARRGTGVELAELVLVLRDMSAAPEGIRFEPQDSASILAEIIRRFPTLEKPERLLILASAPPAWRMPAIGALDEVAGRDRDLDVLTFVLLARIDDPNHTLLNEVLWNDRPGVLRLVRFVKQRLIEGVSTYSRPAQPGADEAGGLGSPSLGGAMGDTVRP
jgi:tetratricopeptide (TPR) repeat protein